MSNPPVGGLFITLFFRLLKRRIKVVHQLTSKSFRRNDFWANYLISIDQSHLAYRWNQQEFPIGLRNIAHLVMPLLHIPRCSHWHFCILARAHLCRQYPLILTVLFPIWENIPALPGNHRRWVRRRTRGQERWRDCHYPKGWAPWAFIIGAENVTWASRCWILRTVRLVLRKGRRPLLTIR